MAHTSVFPRLTGLIETIPAFKPHAYYSKHGLLVFTKDCSSTQRQRVSLGRTEIFWEKNRPWYAPWRKCVGFAIYCGPGVNFSGEVLVVDVLDWIEREQPHTLEKYRALFYRVAKDLMVHIPHEPL